ncbi:MAG: hypothetical protein JWL77_7057 [Chthonomonadaceae bacterium]|nr:hypothetical protein [Chthonomonadaceae bacterium]
MRGPVSVLLTGLLSGSFLVAGAPAAWADDHAPQITSMDIAAPPAPGGALVVAVHAADPQEQGYGISFIRLDWQLLDDAGDPVAQLEADGYPEVAASVGNSPTGIITVTKTLSPYMAAGHWQLVTASAYDNSGNLRRYHRDGTIEDIPIVNTSDGVSPDNTLDLTTGDFDMTNSLGDGHGDSAAPVLDSVEQLTSTVTPGEPAAVKLTARDDLSGVRRLSVTYESPSGSTRFGVATAPGLAGTGLASGLVPPGAEPGTWKADGLSVEDNVGSRIDYSTSLKPIYLPSGVRPFATQPDINWAALDLQIANAGPADTDPPVLHAVSLVTPKELKAGDPVEFDYSVSDASGVLGIGFTLQDVHNHTAYLNTECITGRLIRLLPLGLDPGPLILESVTVYDPLYQNRGYLRDGTTPSDVTGTTGTGTHDFNLPSMDMTIDPGEGSLLDNPTLVPSPYACPGVATVTTTAPAAAAPATVALLTGNVTVAGQPLPNATLAVYRTDVATHAVSFDGLAHTDITGHFNDPVTVTRPSTWRAQFLGHLPHTGSPAGAPAAFGPARTVLWQRSAKLTGPTRLAAGTTATLTAAVKPVPATTGSVLVVFQRWYSGAWHEVGRVRTATPDSAGASVARFVTRPPLGRSVYRAIVPGNVYWLSAGSKALTISKG